ncbi:MAG: type II toxin-antitoxin system Phd/YefM family antitoxin [Thermosynechococcaceae cyanobacterium]
MQSISSRDFNQDVGKAKRAAADGPVLITDRGTPAHVLLTVDEYNRLTSKGKSVGESLGMPEIADIEFNPIPLRDAKLRDIDLS